MLRTHDKRRDLERPTDRPANECAMGQHKRRSVRSIVRLVLYTVVLTLVGIPLFTLAEPYFTAEDLERNAKLTPALRKLILAYENYIELYPDTERAKDFLLDEAGRFRDVDDEQTAIAVFQRVLRRPDVTQADRAYTHEQIMDAYREIGDYASQEEWAHRMSVADVGPEKQQQAKDFIFQAGYNRAKDAEDKKDYTEAARAYERLAVRNPDHDQAPNAMLKAAQMWEDAGDMNRAALTYERFYYTYPDYRDPATGRGALAALETAAAIYAEQDDYRHTADAVERILAASPNHPDRMKYLNNLASIYALVKDYNNAIRTRQEFIASYPNDPKAGSYQWDIAEYRGLVGQRQQQLAEYEAFVRNYPSDWRAIEANYRIGRNRLDGYERAVERGRSDESDRLLALARTHFERAVVLHDSISAPTGGDGGDLMHAIRSLSEVSKMDSSDYYSITLEGSPSFSADSARKWETLQDASQTYLKLANYGYPPVTFEALYKRGRILEDFAYEYLKQPRPDTAITYDEILRTFSINAVSQTILRDVAAPAYEKQMLEFYEQNASDIDTAAAEVEDEELRTVHHYWMDRARERLAAIPAVVDSLELNTIQYEADLLVLDAQQKIPERFENAWTRFAEEHRQRYQENPRLVYADKQQVFDLGVSPLVYGVNRDTLINGMPAVVQDTTAMVPRFQQIIEKGSEIGEDWQIYNRGRLRLVYAAKSEYYKQVADEAIHTGLAEQVDALYNQSQVLVATIESLPSLDLSSIGEPPTRPDLTPPEPPQRPPGEPTTWPREVALQFIQDFKQYQEDVQNLQARVRRYQRNVERYRERRQALIEQQTQAYRGVLQDAGEKAREFGQVALQTQLFRISTESTVEAALRAHERDIAFGDSIRYSDSDMRAVRDSALAFGFESARGVDSLFQVMYGVREQYTEKRDTGTGGEGTPAFQVANNLVTGYAAVADSFRTAAIRRYLYVFEGRDSIFAVGLEHPTVQRAIERLRALDPTFGVITVPMTFTFVTEDSTGLWRVSAYVDPNNPDAWRDREFADTEWVPAMRAPLQWYYSHEYTPPPQPETESYESSDTYGDTLSTAMVDTTDSYAERPVVYDADRPAGEPLYGFPERGNQNLAALWAPSGGDTVYFRRAIELPPRWNELPDSLRTPEAPKPVIEKATITVTADDDYRVYLNGQVTNARDQSASVDWQQSQTVDILKDQFFIGDTTNVFAIQAINETRIDRVPNTDVDSYGFIARIDIQMNVPYGIYEALYKPPEPEPEFMVALTPQDSLVLADTTGRYFATSIQRQQWIDCRIREIRASWQDTVQIPWRLDRVRMDIANVDTAMAQVQRWLVEQKRDAETRLAEAAGAAMGADFGTGTPTDDSSADGYDGNGDGSYNGSSPDPYDDNNTGGGTTTPAYDQ